MNLLLSLNLAPSLRTVKLNENGETAVVTISELQKGKKLFINTCSGCHTGGITKTNPNVGLAISTLENATPPRDNIFNLINYVKNPTSYDGQDSLLEVHPNLSLSWLYPSISKATDKDLYDIAGYILVEGQVLGEKWGGGKVYY